MLRPKHSNKLMTLPSKLPALFLSRLGVSAS